MRRPPSPSASASEFSRSRRARDLGRSGETISEKATEAERAALARRFGVKDVPRFAVQAALKPESGGWRVSGVAKARVVQECVVTLEDVTQEIEEPFSRLFLPDAPPPNVADLDPDEPEDPPEPLEDRLDPAEMAAEAVALAIDPYPRKPGASLDLPGDDVPEAERRPFAALAALRERMTRDGG